MSLLDLIQTNPEEAQAAIFDALNNKAFDFLDNYELDEAVVAGSVKKDERGNVKSFKTVGDKHDPVVKGSVKKDKDGNVVSFKTEDFEAMSQEDFDSIDESQLDELSVDTLNSYRNKRLKQGANTSNSDGIKTAYKKVQKIYNAKKPSQDAQTQGDLRGGKY